MKENLIYLNYWKRKKLLQSGVPHFPVLRWWLSEGLCEIDRIIFNKIKERETILDVGAGNLRTMRQFQQAGYSGEYHTQDIGEEFTYTYQEIDDITKKYAAILCLDVIEHLQLSEGLELIHSLVNLLEPGGVIVIQTPNACCIKDPLSWDMTHLHSYNIQDLWAYLTCMGLHVEGYRVVFGSEHKNFAQHTSHLLRYIITRRLGVDYTHNIVLVATKKALNE